MVVAFTAGVAVLALLTVLPGPDMAVVTRVWLASGRRAAAGAAAGIAAGLLVWGLLTVAGLAAVLAASSEAYTIVKLAGATYLIALGVQGLWRARRPRAEPPARGSPAVPPRAAGAPPAPPSGAPPWRTGLLANLLNPKIAVFYTSVLPQLVPAGAPTAAWLSGLVLAHAALTLLWLNAYAAVLHRASRALTRPGARRALDAGTGVVLVGLGVRVAVER